MDSIHEMDNIENIYETDATEEEAEARETNKEENSDDWKPHRFGFSRELEDYSEPKESQSDGYSSDWEPNSGSEGVLDPSELMDDERDDDYARLTRVHIYEQPPRSLGAYIGSRIEPLLQQRHAIQVLKYFLYTLLREVWIGCHTVVRILRDLLNAIKSIIGYPYQYRDIKISKLSLRLLILLPGSFHEDIRCYLIHTSLDEPRSHQYEALSYTWGPPERNHFIWIDAYKFPVTANLYQALQHLRQDVVRFLWVDAICLNQENIQERNHQVKQMTMIYREAWRVIIWLGPAGDYSDRALEFIPTLRRFRLRRQQRRRVFSLKDVYKALKSLEAMAKICRRPWWQRVWIVQELASAKSEVVVQCGHSQWPWHAFIEGAELMKEQREGLNFYNPLMPAQLFPADVLYIISKLDGIRYGKKRGDLNLLYLLEEARGSQATDKRDHVYALLGLAPSHCTIGFETDYAKSTYQVYLDTARHLIQNRNDLSVFGSRLQDTDINLPSWVTDWSKPYDGIQLLRDGTPYRAAGNSKASFRFLANPAHLAVRGVIIDKIHGLCHSTHLELFPWDNWVDRLMGLSRRQTNLGNGKQPAMAGYIQIPRKSGFNYSQRANLRSLVEYNRKESFIEAYWRTLIGDSTREGEFPAPASFGRRFEVLHLEREIKDREAIQPWKSDDSIHQLATIIEECYPSSSREEWARRLNSLRNESKETLLEESGNHTQPIRHQYSAKDRGLNGEINGTTSEVGFADKESKSDTSMKPRVPIPPPVPEVPFASKTVSSFTWDYSDRMVQVTRNCALFCTSKDYIGLASHFAQDGDKICVFLGCNTPVIIREKDDMTHELIGAAYLHGFMQGEVLSWIERGEVELEVFVIS